MTTTKLMAFAAAQALGVLELAGGVGAQCEEAVLTQSVPGDYSFGGGVSIDSGTAVVSTGVSVYVFERVAGSWVQTDRLTVNEGMTLSIFTTDVELSGSRLIVGAPSYGIPPSVFNQGAAYIFEQQAGNWTAVAQLLASDGAGGDVFGEAVALDGETAVASAWAKNTAAGAVYVFEGPSWQETAILTASDTTNGLHFGIDVAISGDTIVVGAESDDTFGFNSGAAYVFERSGNGWTEVAKLYAPSSAIGGVFGLEVAIDGTRTLIGARGLNLPGPGTGAAFLFERLLGSWVLTEAFTPDVVSAGWKVAVDGDHVLVGAALPAGATGGGWPGPVTTYESVNGNWTETGALVASAAVVLSGYPSSVDVCAGEAIIGASGANADEAYVFAPFSPTVYCTAKINSLGCTPQITWQGIPSLVQPAGFTLSASNIVEFKNGIFFYGTGARTAVPFFGGTLCVDAPLQRTVPLNSGGATPCSGSFMLDFNTWVQGGLGPILTAGAVVRGQFWYRDPAHPDGTDVGLTDAVEFPICP